MKKDGIYIPLKILEEAGWKNTGEKSKSGYEILERKNKKEEERILYKKEENKVYLLYPTSQKDYYEREGVIII